jgi:hypothetical protein
LLDTGGGVGWAGGDGIVSARDWVWDWDWEELYERDVGSDGPEEEIVESREETSSDLLEEGGERT